MSSDGQGIRTIWCTPTALSLQWQKETKRHAGRVSITDLLVSSFHPWSKRQNHGWAARVLTWKSQESLRAEGEVSNSLNQNETKEGKSEKHLDKHIQTQVWKHGKAQSKAWRWERGTVLRSFPLVQPKGNLPHWSPDQCLSRAELHAFHMYSTGNPPPVEDGEDSCQFRPVLSGRTGSWKMGSGVLSKTDSEKSSIRRDTG